MFDPSYQQGRSRSGGRFTLLLLSEGEYYVRDFVATCMWPRDVRGGEVSSGEIPGILRLCTQSMFFEADDVRVPIVRIPFLDVESLEGADTRTVRVLARRWARMKTNGLDVPYEWEKGRLVTWSFKITYSHLSGFMNVANKMLIISRLPRAEEETQIASFIDDSERALRFNVAHLRNPSSEPILFEKSVVALSPLIRQPGRLVLTPERIYFQPLYDLGGEGTVKSHLLEAVASVVKRRSALKDVGLEFFFLDSAVGGLPGSGPSWGSSSAFFSFRSQKDRDNAMKAVLEQNTLGCKVSSVWRGAVAVCLELSSGWLPRVTMAWQHGKISNFDYLLYCNFVAGRSFNDLTQYPVFPWILKNYTSSSLDLTNPDNFRDLSRPIGALNPERLRQFRSRYHDMMTERTSHLDAESPFMYGTHYSCPGYTLFWLVRAAPGHMLRLQNGKFDAPDRLFCSVAEAWDSAMNNPSDVKELIPEFFMPERASFLVNRYRLKLGARQDGRFVHDVLLPPWANGSPERFISLHREALESEFVSANLHHWLDLIFGVKQRGPAALAADNVFRELTYEGAVDLESISDPVQRLAMETAINEFGQTPKQIFQHPHPKRLFYRSSNEQGKLHASYGDAVLSDVDTSVPPMSVSLSSRARGAEDERTSHRSVQLALVEVILSATEDALQDNQSSSSLEEMSRRLVELDVACRPSSADAKDLIQRSSGSDDVRLSHDQRQTSSLATGSTSSAAAVTSDVNPGDNTSKDPPSPLSSSSHTRVHHQIMGHLGQLRSALDRAMSSGREVASAAASYMRNDHLGNRDLALATDQRKKEDNTSSTTSTTLASLAGALPSRWQQIVPSDTKARGALHQRKSHSEHVRPMDAKEQDSATEDNVNKEHILSLTAAEMNQRSSGAAVCGGDMDEDGSSKTVDVVRHETRAWLVGGKGEDIDAAPTDWLNDLGSRRFEIDWGQQWGHDLRNRLQIGPTFCGTEAANDVCLWYLNDRKRAYVAYEDAILRIYDVDGMGKETKRTYRLGQQPLTSIVAISRDPGEYLSSMQPIICCGSYDTSIHVIDTESGAIMGTFGDHEDSVSCLSLGTTRSGNRAMASGSWDCSVKLWSLEEGRQPWDGAHPQSLAMLNLPGAPWSLQLVHGSDLAVVGSEDGDVMLIDFRVPAGRLVHAIHVSNDYIGGVRMLPDSTHAIVASGDGMLTTLDLRVMSDGDVSRSCEICSVHCGSAVRCCETDGETAVLGAETGKLLFWDVGRAVRAATAADVTPEAAGMLRHCGSDAIDVRDTPGTDGMYEPLAASEACSCVNALACGVYGGEVCIVSVHDDGLLQTFWTK